MPQDSVSRRHGTSSGEADDVQADEGYETDDHTAEVLSEAESTVDEIDEILDLYEQITYPADILNDEKKKEEYAGLATTGFVQKGGQ